MQPAELLQRRVVQRLHAERDAVDAGRADSRESASASTLVGLASSVTSTSGAIGQCRAIASRIAPTVAGCISEGVPPPKKMVETVRPGTRAAVAAISAAKARAKRASSMPAWRTWLLKSQYGHFDRQNGQCT